MNNPTELDSMYAIQRIANLSDFSFSEYLKFVEPLAYEVEIKYGIYHLVPMIQSAHESRNGNSGLARFHGNLFGIKSTKGWKEAGNTVVQMSTWEEIKGKKVDINQEFRGYKTWRDSFNDWADLISSLNIYKDAYKLLKDVTTVRLGIKEMAMVYATDSDYASKLLSIYETAQKSGTA